MVIDAHVLAGQSIFGYELMLEDLLANMNRYGIDRAVLVPVQPHSYRLEPENTRISQWVTEKPERFIGFGRVDPRLGKDALQEVERAVGELGLQGIFLHPWEEGYRANDPLVTSVVDRAYHLGVPVMVATGYPWVSHALQVAELAKSVPGAAVIMTHGGQINISGLAQEDAFLAMSQCERLYMETSGVYRQDFIEESIECFGAARVMFGSHSPRMHQGFELDRALSATKKDDEIRKAVLGGSLLKLLRMEDADDYNA